MPFFKTRRMVLGATMLAALGILNWLFASVELPFANDGGDSYRAAVVYLTIPLGSSLTALSMLPSRLSWWERRSIRRLFLQRAIAYWTATAGAVFCTLCGAERTILPHPVTLGLQGVLAGVGVGGIILHIASYEICMTTLLVYGLAGILVPPTVEATRLILLFGGSASSVRLSTALAVWLAGGLLFSLGPEYRGT